MDRKQIAILGCKFLGLYAFIQSIPLMGGIFQVIAFAKDDPALTIGLFIASCVPTIMMAGFGIFLFFYSETFALKMLSNDQINGDFKNPSSKDIQTIAFSIVGLIMVVLAIPKIGQIALNAYSLKSAGDQRNVQQLLSQNWAFTLQTALQFIIGFFLFIGSELLSSAWHFVINRLKHERKI